MKTILIGLALLIAGVMLAFTFAIIGVIIFNYLYMSDIPGFVAIAAQFAISIIGIICLAVLWDIAVRMDTWNERT